MAFGVLRDLVRDRHDQHAGEHPADFAVLGADQVPIVELWRGGGRGGRVGACAARRGRRREASKGPASCAEARGETGMGGACAARASLALDFFEGAVRLTGGGR